MIVPKITEISSDDWCRLYYNGQPFYEGHSIRADVILDKLVAMGIMTHEYVYLDDVDTYNPNSSFPDVLPNDLTTLPGFIGY